MVYPHEIDQHPHILAFGPNKEKEAGVQDQQESDIIRTTTAQQEKQGYQPVEELDKEELIRDQMISQGSHQKPAY